MCVCVCVCVFECFKLFWLSKVPCASSSLSCFIFGKLLLLNQVLSGSMSYNVMANRIRYAKIFLPLSCL